MTGSNNESTLGIDVGTSHTVAVLTWPGGRTETLLVDSSPVMPSAVYLDEAGVLHVGQDAQRLAQIDPARLEPNPKLRLGEGEILLGDREIADTDVLSALLRAVAAKATETVGHLPPTVLTYPAKWGPQRREQLSRAATNAGMSVNTMVPEPVAAAHYFAHTMRQPVGVDDALAVFDFGGGTLDVAVVQRNARGGFTVLCDGGLDDLGGLDVDAALVDHIGKLIVENHPQVWHGLSEPAGNAQLRQRREFWDQIRGAKEMLSRGTVAPVLLPGTETAWHLTRDELDRVTEPLFARAVAETRRVIEAAGLQPVNLAGLFLVGGASRIPMAARMLHYQLGIAPTVMEQPELPVASGALLATRATPEAAEPQRYRPSAVEVMATAPYAVDRAADAHVDGSAAESDGAAVEPPTAAPAEKEPPPSKPPLRRRRIVMSGIAAAVLLIASGIFYFAYGQTDICDDADIRPLQNVATKEGDAESDSSGGQVHEEHCYIPFEGTDLNVASMDIFRETHPDSDAAQSAYQQMREEETIEAESGGLDDVTGYWIRAHRSSSGKHDRQYQELEENVDNFRPFHAEVIDVVLVEGETIAGVRWLILEEPANRDLPDTVDAFSATAQSVL